MAEEGKGVEVIEMADDDRKISNEVGVVKKGDYLIHLFIQEARNLRMKGSETVDPIIEVS